MLLTEPPTSVGWAEVEGLRGAAMRLKRADMRNGGGYALRQADAQVKQAKMVLEAPCRPSSKPNLFGERAAAAAWVFNNAAFARHDVGEHLEAYRLWWLAIETVKSANNWPLAARIFGQQSRQHLAIGQPDKALADLSHAIEGDRRKELSGTDLAMLHALRARAYGKLGDEQATLTEIGEADKFMYSKSSPDDAADRPWISHYDVAHHQGDTGAALRALVGHGYRHRSAAIGLYEQALTGTADANERSGILVCGSLVWLHLTDGGVEIERGYTLGHDMLSRVERNGMMSRRVVDRITRMHNILDPARFRGPEADDLREHIVSTLSLIGP